jgi:hypothetical protein
LLETAVGASRNVAAKIQDIATIIERAGSAADQACLFPVLP